MMGENFVLFPGGKHGGSSVETPQKCTFSGPQKGQMGHTGGNLENFGGINGSDAWL